MEKIETYDLYAIESIDLEAIRLLLEKALGIHLAAHESDAFCGDYYRFDHDDSHIILHYNQDPIDKEWTAPEAKHCGLLLRVDAMPNFKEIEEKLIKILPGIILLEREEV